MNNKSFPRVEKPWKEKRAFMSAFDLIGHSEDEIKNMKRLLLTLWLCEVLTLVAGIGFAFLIVWVFL